MTPRPLDVHHRDDRRRATPKREAWVSPGGYKGTHWVYTFADGTRLRREGNAWLVEYETGKRWAIESRGPS